jgi:nucleotide-binding universal stress UspA family protein
MKKVLIALDYDPTAQNVAEAGFSLAKSMNAEIILLHVISEPVYYSSMEYSPVMGYTGYMEMGQLQSVTIAGLKEASLKFLDKSRQHLGDNTIQTIVKEGNFADTILETAEEEHADIIAIGSHGRKWIENILMGSVTEKVLHSTTIPLFIIPTRKRK